MLNDGKEISLKRSAILYFRNTIFSFFFFDFESAKTFIVNLE